MWVKFDFIGLCAPNSLPITVHLALDAGCQGQSNEDVTWMSTFYAQYLSDRHHSGLLSMIGAAGVSVSRWMVANKARIDTALLSAWNPVLESDEGNCRNIICPVYLLVLHRHLWLPLGPVFDIDNVGPAAEADGKPGATLANFDRTGWKRSRQGALARN